MSFSFGGMAVNKDYSGKFEALLDKLGIARKATGSGFSMTRAISGVNGGSAIAAFNGQTLLFDQLLPYDCSFSPGEESRLDKRLAAYAVEESVLVFMLDGISETYGFSLFEQGKRRRRWGIQPKGLLCDDGELLKPESAFIAGNINYENIFSTPGEMRVIAVLEYFLKADFNELLTNENRIYHLFV